MIGHSATSASSGCDAHPGRRRPGRLTRSVVRRLLTMVAMASVAGVCAPSSGPAVAAPTGATTAQDWPTYLHDVQRSAASGETILTSAKIGALFQKWQYQTGGVIAAAPAVVNNVVYIGSWDGNEYALNGTTGALIWKQFLGTTTDPVCHPPNLGITSSATVVNGVVYVGGGDSNWYALSAATGAVLWRVFTGDNSQQGAHYNWSSPLIVGNFGYIGIASNCDAPLVQGQVLKVDLTSHQVVGTLNLVPNGQVGGGVWTSPTYDPATQTVFVSTGTLNLYTQTMSQAVVAFDANAMTVKSSWQLPFEVAVSDSDFGTTPTLTVGSNGRKLVSVANKNGVLYTLDRNNLAAGPIWQAQIAVGGDCPTCGDGSISSGAFANGVLYYAGGSNEHNGQGYRGSVTAFDPLTGHVIWYHGTNEAIFGSIAYSNGLIVESQGTVLEVLDAATGNSLFDYKLTAPVYAAPAISHGQIYFGGTDSFVRAFGMPATITPPPPDPTCPTGYTCQAVGNAGTGGEVVNGDGSWTITSGGSGIHSDQFRLVSKPVAGDNQMTVETMGQSVQGLRPEAGIVERASASPGAPYFAVWMTPVDPNEGETQPKVLVAFRDTWNAPWTELTKVYPTPYPTWLMIQRHGDVFNAAYSRDGTHYQLIPGTQHTVVMPTTLVGGLAVAAGQGATSGTAQFANLNAGGFSITPTPHPTAHPCPTGWTCQSVNDPAPTGDQTLVNGTWTITGVGYDILNSQDTFHYVYQSLAADGTISAQVTSVGASAPGAKAGLMMRGSLDPGSPFYGIFVTNGVGGIVQWRQYNGLTTRLDIPLPNLHAPTYLQLSRFTDTSVTPNVTYYSAMTSTDGVNWSEVPGSTQALALGNGPTLAGMAGTAHVGNAASNPSTFQGVSVTTTSTRPPGVCPTNWTCQDVGQGFVAGTQNYDSASGTWTFNASGGDIWDVYDQFHFAYQTLTTDATLSARVVSFDPQADPWEKAGVMMRASADPQAPYYAVFTTPGNGVAVQWRSTQAATTNQVLTGGAAPNYVMIGRWTDTQHGGVTYYTGYTSTDNHTFTPIPGSTVAVALPAAVLAGIAADSHQQAFARQTVFDSVATIPSAPAPPGACPTAYAGCADIGNPTPTGSQTLTGSTLSVQGGGGDIWSTSDQFHMVWQTLSADGTVAAHLAAMTSPDPWTKGGVMLRASTDPSAPYYAFFATGGNGLVVQYRSAAGGNTSQIAVPGNVPAWLQVGRWTSSGPTPTTYYTAYTSTDGTTWTAVAGSTVPLVLTTPTLAGIALTSHNTGQIASATVDSFTVATTSTPPPGVCTGAWGCADIGGATPAGTQTINGSSLSVQGGGGDIWATSDQFRMVWQTLASDGTLSVHLSALTPTNAWSKAGLMLRATNDPAAPYYAILATPSNGIVIQVRTTQGGTTSQSSLAGAAPAWLELSRWTDTTASPPVTYYTAYTSPDGTTWSAVAGSTVALSLPASVLAGVAVTSHDTTTLATATFDSFALATTSTAPPGVCPAAWTCQDIGGATPGGTQTVSGGTWSVQAGGGDISDPTDEFRFISQTLAANGTLAARVVNQSNTNAWAKAGIMLRGSNDPVAPYYAVLVTPTNGLVIQYRSAQGGVTSYPTSQAGAAPLYLQITRNGTTVSAATSPDGTTWTPVPNSSATIAGFTGSVLAGMAATSHNTTQLGTVTYDSVSLTATAAAMAARRPATGTH